MPSVGSKTEVGRRNRDFRFTPESRHQADKATSLDHLIGAAEQHRWHFEAERFRSLEIDNQLEFGRLVKRDISRISTSKNSIDEVGNAAIRIGHQPANFDEFAEGVNCGNSV